jgi:hypothetical protein
MPLDSQAPTVAPEAPPTHWRLMALALLLGGGVLLASFFKADLTHNDFERFDDLRLTFLFFALIGAACVAYAALWREAPALSAQIVLGTALAAGALLLASFPVGSKDVFLYAFIGKVWGTYHTNPYTPPPAAFVADPWQPFAQVIWAQQPTPYGPLFLWQARLVDRLAAGRLFAAVWVYKAIAAAALAGAIAVAVQLMDGAAGERRYRIALLAWNPLLLFESAGNGHNDAVMLLLVLGAVWLHQRGDPLRWLFAPAPLALAIWYKWYALLFLPAFLLAVYRDGDREQMRRWILVLVVAVIAGGGLLLAPLAEAVPLVVQRLVAHENLRQVFPLQLSPVLAVLLWGLEATGQVGGRWPLMWFDVIRLGLFALSALLVLILQGRGKLGLIESLCGLSVAFTLLVVTVLWPWGREVPHRRHSGVARPRRVPHPDGSAQLLLHLCVGDGVACGSGCSAVDPPPPGLCGELGCLTVDLAGEEGARCALALDGYGKIPVSTAPGRARRCSVSARSDRT